MVAVLTIISILAAIALPNYQRSIVKARESVLKENLYWMRDAIDQYFLDNGKYPESLEQLVEKKYLRAIPIDPITEKKDWIVVREEFDEFSEPDFEPGIWNVKSRARGRALDRSRYRSW
jgi:general secretion pathway protein G